MHGQELPASVRGTQRLTLMTRDQKAFPCAGSPYKFTKHGKSGTELCELLPHLGTVADEMCVVRSMWSEALQAAGFSGQLIEIRAGEGHPFMICYSFDGGKTSITDNGRHLAVRVANLVFDNLHPGGLPYEEWFKDFDAAAGIEVVAVTDF